jgi:glycosyltransferase involved in cell wall biosynthesis
MNLLAAPAAVACGIPCVAVEHNMDGWRTSGWLYAACDRVIGKLNAGRIAVGQAVARMLIDQRVVPADKIRIVSNAGFEPVTAGPGRARVRERFGIRDGQVGVVVVARLVEQKGHDVLLRALSRVPDVDRLRVVCIGEGPRRDGLERMVAARGLEAVVTLAGQLPSAASLLAGFDILALPSRWEGLPLVVVEAMAAGLPVIASATGATPEVVTDGETGLLVPPGDEEALARALGRLAADEDLRRRMGAAGRSRRPSGDVNDSWVRQYLDALVHFTARH